MINNNKQALWQWADWPAPNHIRAGTSFRIGGFSHPPFNGLNLAQHVGDDPSCVIQNRKALSDCLALKAEPVWLNQTHSKRIICLDENIANNHADGASASRPERVCAILTADCVPILFCDKGGHQIAAIHAGWRGICGGIIENALQQYPDPSDLLVWIGPCISPAHYEVDQSLYNACIAHLAILKDAFLAKDAKHWYCNLTDLVKIILKNNGVMAIYQCNLCTYEQSDLLYSYRRDGKTGRCATMIWMETGSF